MRPVSGCEEITEGVFSGSRTSVRYLERQRDSPDVVILLHGLGLDANDYRRYLQHADGHAIALTMAGFDPLGTVPVREPVSADEHIEVITEFIGRVHARWPAKRLILMGFSLGADMVLRLAEYWRDGDRKTPAVHAVLLLDPNVNQSTMTISRIFADTDPADPLPKLHQVVDLASDVVGLRNLCQYLCRVLQKDFGQIRQHARDFVAYWPPSGSYDALNHRLSTVAGLADHVGVVLSGSYRPHLPFIRADLPNVKAAITDLDHFELIEEDRLDKELNAVR